MSVDQKLEQIEAQLRDVINDFWDAHALAVCGSREQEQISDRMYYVERSLDAIREAGNVR